MFILFSLGFESNIDFGTCTRWQFERSMFSRFGSFSSSWGSLPLEEAAWRKFPDKDSVYRERVFCKNKCRQLSVSGNFPSAWSLSSAELNYVARSGNSPSRTSGGWVERSCSFLGWGSGGMCCRGRSPPLSWSSCSRSSRGCSVDGSHWTFETLAGTACCRKDPI